MDQVAAGLALGFVASLHCILMCGPLAHALPVGSVSRNRVKGLRSRFVLGRWFVYAAMGFVVGALQKPVSWLGIQDVFLWVSVLALFFLVVWWEKDFFVSLRKRLQSWSRSLIDSNPTGSFFVLGMANGLLPCGAVYAALALASLSGSSTLGAITMVGFGIANSWWHVFLISGIRVPHFSMGPLSFLSSQRVSVAIVVLSLVFRMVHNTGHEHSQGSENLKTPTSMGVCQKPDIQMKP